ncbi:MAG: DUF4390 domain-containing protein [Gammaproteobacteria bacterium]|nr:MAG: DUF4390 domain-containing protein [Gammaproteobacteria bacterium]
MAYLTENADRIRGRGTGRRYLLLALFSLFFFTLPALASDAKIRDVRTLLSDGVYRLGARVDFTLNDTLQQALQNGVPLVLELRIEVIRERDWLWAERAAHLRQRFGLQFHALTRRYLVDNYSTDVQYSFLELEEALDYIGNIYDLPLIDANLLKPQYTYWVRMRADLDIESLPTPVRLWAYLGSDWSLHSDWHQWPLQP